jgi:hypothetical protein
MWDFKSGIMFAMPRRLLESLTLNLIVLAQGEAAAEKGETETESMS